MTNQKFQNIFKTILIASFLSFSSISNSQGQIRIGNNFERFSILLFNNLNLNLLEDRTFTQYPYNLLFEHDVVFLSTNNARKLYTVKGKIGNQTGYFIIDSGSHSLVFNSKYLSPGYLARESNSNSLTGQLEIFKNQSTTFEVGNRIIKNIRGHIADLTELEAQFNVVLLGLIGYQFLKEYEVVFNLNKEIISLHMTDKHGNWINNGFEHPNIIDSLEFELKQGFPVVTVEINGKKRKMLIDSGAEYCFIKHKNDIKIKDVSSIYGVNGKPVTMKIGRIKKIKMTDKFSSPSVTTVLTSSHRLSDLYFHNIDGVIGQNVFEQWVIGINYKKKKVYFYDYKFQYK